MSEHQNSNLSPPSSTDLDDKLAILDQPGEWDYFSSKNDQGSWSSKVTIQGIQCTTCGINIEHTLKKISGIQSVQVNTGIGQATITWDSDQIKPSTWLNAINQLGYFALPAGDSLLQQERKKELRMALWRWLVAALCMMQVMMYSYPIYTATEGEITDNTVQLLRWGLWILSTPVLLFSCKPFFSNAWKGLVNGRINMDLPVTLGMLLTFFVSTAGTFDPHGVFGQEVFFDSFTMFVFFLLSGRWLELMLKDKTLGALELLINRLPASTLLIKDEGEIERVSTHRLKVGQLIQVMPGEIFPADGLIEFGSTLVDEAMLTGESTAIKKGLSESVLAGTVNLESTIHVRITQVGEGTKFSDIVRLMEDASSKKPHLVQLIDRMAIPFLMFVMGAAIFSMVWWWSVDPARALMVGATVLIVTCPCALSLATPAALLATAGTLARSGVLVKNLSTLESLEKINTVIFDKTGTLTEDGLLVKGVTTRSGVNEHLALGVASMIANQSLHPVSRAFRDYVCDGITLISSQERPGFGIDAQLVVNDKSDDFKFGSAEFCGLSNKHLGRVHLSDDYGWFASFEIEEILRKEASQSIKTLQANKIDVILLSGDSRESVNQFSAHFQFTESVGHCTPDGKLNHLKMLQSQGKQVAMVGDGMNDAPVLAAAQASFAFGTKVPLAQTKADFVVLTKNLMRIPQSLELGKKMMSIIRQNLYWAIVYNVICVPLAMFGYLPAWLAGLGMALSSLLVIANATRLYKRFPDGEV